MFFRADFWYCCSQICDSNTTPYLSVLFFLWLSIIFMRNMIDRYNFVATLCCISRTVVLHGFLLRSQLSFRRITPFFFTDVCASIANTDWEFEMSLIRTVLRYNWIGDSIDNRWQSSCRGTQRNASLASWVHAHRFAKMISSFYVSDLKNVIKSNSAYVRSEFQAAMHQIVPEVAFTNFNYPRQVSASARRLTVH